MYKNSANFTVVSEKHFRSTSGYRPQPSYPSFLQCVSGLWKKPAKSSVAISPRFPVIYGQETLLTPCPGLLCTSKETYCIINCKSSCY